MTKVDQNLLQRIQYNYDMVGVCWWPNDHAGMIPQLVELVFSGIFLHFSGIQMFASKQEASWAYNHIHPAAICQYLIYSYIVPLLLNLSRYLRLVEAFTFKSEQRSGFRVSATRKNPIYQFLQEEMMVVLIAAIKNTLTPILRQNHI